MTHEKVLISHEKRLIPHEKSINVAIIISNSQKASKNIFLDLLMGGGVFEVESQKKTKKATFFLFFFNFRFQIYL